MANISMTKLNSAMKDEKITIYILESLTRKGIYKDMLAGYASKKDITDVASVLGCKVDDLFDVAVRMDRADEQTPLKPNLNEKAAIAIDVAEELKEIGFNQTTFIEYIHISSGTYYTNITIKTPLRMNSLTSTKIAYGLNCSLEYLFGLTTERGHSDFTPDLSKNPHLVKIIPISNLINGGKTSPNTVSKFIHLPYTAVKHLMVTGGYIPKYSLERIGKLYNIEPETLLETSKLKMLTSFTPEMKRAINTKVVPIGEVTAEDFAKAVEVATVTEKTPQVVKYTPQEDDNISLSQLGEIISVMSQRPELLQIFNELCRLNDDDYKHIHEHLKWLIGKSKTEHTA